MLNGTLKDDTSFIGYIVKFVIVAVGLALVLLPIKAMFGSRAQQEQWKTQLGRGVRQSGQAMRDEFGSVRKAVKTVTRETRGILDSSLKTFT